MDSTEKIAYSLGALDMWQLFKSAQNDPNTALKKAYVFENLIQDLAPTMVDSELNELIQEFQQEGIMEKISKIIQQKRARDEMLKEIAKHKIDWSQN